MRYFCGDITHVQAFVDQPGLRRRAQDVMLSIASINVRFANGAVGYLLSQRGDAPFGLGGWWSLEVAGTHGTFCIENCIEKITFWSASKPGSGPGNKGADPVVTNTGITDFNQTFLVASMPSWKTLPTASSKRICAPRDATPWRPWSASGRSWSPTSRAGPWCGRTRCRRCTAIRRH